MFSKKKTSELQIPMTTLTIKDPTIPASIPTTSKDPGLSDPVDPPADPFCMRCLHFMYNRQKKLFCGRTCKSWWAMIGYTIMYLLFLATYTMIFLYSTLSILNLTADYLTVDKAELFSYSKDGIGLTATPASVNNYPLISYRDGEFQKYVDSIHRLLSEDKKSGRRKRDVQNHTDLGPCGTPPYGYGDKPCVIIRLNKQLKWSGKPLNSSMNVPQEVEKLLRLKKQMLWLQCKGIHSYDDEHIKSIHYYPYPPGFDSDLYPLDMQSKAPLLAIQIADFTLGLSLAIECKLWYDGGVSSTKFVLYVEPKNKSFRD